MNAIQLQMNNEDVDLWSCSNCGRVYRGQEAGDKCCVCSYCGRVIEENAELSSGFLVSHAECIKKNRLEAYQAKLQSAELVKDGTEIIYYQDEYADFETVLDDFQEGDEPLAFLCKKAPIRPIDMEDDVVQSIIELFDEEPNWPEPEYSELEKALDAFNEAVSKTMWEWVPDYTKKIDLRTFING